MSTDAQAAKRFADRRWPDGISCPHCNSLRVSERYRPERRWPQWRCRDCRKEFTALTGTELHGTRLSPSQAEQRYKARNPVWGEPNHDCVLSRGAKSVVNALRQRPIGATIGKIVELTGLSERHTRRLLRQLTEMELVLQRDGNIRAGHRMIPARLWELTYSPKCINILGRIPRHRSTIAATDDSDAVPPQFWHLFWSGAEGSELSLSRDETHIAGTLIGSRDLSAEAWALRTVSTATLKTLSKTRGYDTGDINSLIRTAIRRRNHAKP